MTWFSKLTAASGLVLLAHACYSAQEFATFQSSRAAGSAQPAAAAASAALPIDIVVETITALLIASLGLVLETSRLKPIQWHVWAGKIEREGVDGPAAAGADDTGKDYVGNPFGFLETRPGFVDIRRQRESFEDWVRKSGSQK